MRYARRIDENQPEIVGALRQIGATVEILRGLSIGDIIVGYHGKNFLLEIKDGKKVKSKRKLTLGEQEFHDNWRGQITVVATIEEAIAAVTKR